MKELNISYIIPNLIKRLNVSASEMADLLGVSEKSLNNYLNGSSPTVKVFNKITNILDSSNIDIFDLFNFDGDYLFHASEFGIKGQISANRNKIKKYGLDFGHGFYLSESFKVAITYVDDTEEVEPHIYRFKKEDVCKGKTFVLNDSRYWVLYIGLNRGKIKDETLQSVINAFFKKKLNTADIVVGKIADSFNFEAMDLFFKNIYDIRQVTNALTVANLGMQYVIKNEELANSLEYDFDYAIEKKLLGYIRKCHIKQSNALKEMRNKDIDTGESIAKDKFDSIVLEMLKDE